MADRSCIPEREKAAGELILKGPASWKFLRELLGFNPERDARFCWRPRADHPVVDFVFGQSIQHGLDLLNESTRYIAEHPGETSPFSESDFIVPDMAEPGIRARFEERFDPAIARSGVRLLEAHFPLLLRIYRLLLNLLREDTQALSESAYAPSSTYICLLGIIAGLVPRQEDLKQLPEIGLFRYRLIAEPLEWAIRDYTKTEPEISQRMVRIIAKLRMALAPTIFTRNGILRRLYNLLPENDPRATVAAYRTLPFSRPADSIRSLEKILERTMGSQKRFTGVGAIFFALDFEVQKIISEQLTHVRNLRRERALTEATIKRLYDAGRTYLFRVNAAPQSHPDPAYCSAHEYEGTFVVDMKDFTNIFVVEDVLSAATFVFDEYLEKIHECYKEVKVPSTSKHTSRWTRLVNVVGDAYIIRGDIYSMLLMALKSYAVIEAYKQKVGAHAWLGLEESKLDGGVAIAYRKQAVDKQLDRIPDEPLAEVTLSEGANLCTRLCGRDTDVRRSVHAYTHQHGGSRRYPFKVHAVDQRFYNVGIMIEEDALTALLMDSEHVFRIGDAAPREVALTHTVPVDGLHEEIRRRFFFLPHERELQFTFVRTKEPIKDGQRMTLLVRYVGQVKIKGYERQQKQQLITAYEILFPDRREESFYSLYMKYHGSGEFKKLLQHLV